MRLLMLVALPLGLVPGGCARPTSPPVVALQPGDIGRPEVSVAPKAPWTTGAKVAIGMLIRVERPDGESYYLDDKDVVLDRAVMSVRVTFLTGDTVVGEPMEVPYVHDC